MPLDLSTTSASPRRHLSIRDYAAELERSGTDVLARTNDEFWVRHELWGSMRIPTFETVQPSATVIRDILWRRRALVATYLLEPDSEHPPNATLFVCTDPEYSIEKLPKDRRQNVRRGARELRIEPITVQQVLAHGLQAFSDTRNRVGLTDGTADGFARRFGLRGRCPSHVFLGAWHQQTLVAFLSITEVDDWAEIEGAFSSNTSRLLRPNDTLVVAALTEYLIRRRCKLVSYGLSSIQRETNASGLHEFKTKLGFEPRPVHRAFIAHPILAPFVNRATRHGVRAALALAPHNRMLKKCEGLLSTMLAG